MRHDTRRWFGSFECIHPGRNAPEVLSKGDGLFCCYPLLSRNTAHRERTIAGEYLIDAAGLLEKPKPRGDDAEGSIPMIPLHSFEPVHVEIDGGAVDEA